MEVVLKLYGYTVVQVGLREKKLSVKVNAVNESMLAYIVGGADLFIGGDSGPAHISVACGVKSIIMFGSVRPEYRYPDLSNVIALQEDCEFAGCYHEVVSVRGQDCQINDKLPPCTVISTNKIINAIKKLIE